MYVSLFLNLLCALFTAQLFASVHCQQQCTAASQCYPAGFVAGNVTVPPSLVNCSADGECVCNECFHRSDEEENCSVDAPCWTYDTTENRCKDHRRSQQTAVILAAIVSCVGAANFYVARYECAVPQLLLIVVLICASSFGRVIRCCSDDKKRETDQLCLWCSTIVAAVLAVLALLAIIAWWIADVVIFVQNTRLDGSDCPLREDL